MEEALALAMLLLLEIMMDDDLRLSLLLSYCVGEGKLLAWVASLARWGDEGSSERGRIIDEALLSPIATENAEGGGQGPSRCSSGTS